MQTRAAATVMSGLVVVSDLTAPKPPMTLGSPG